MGAPLTAEAKKLLSVISSLLVCRFGSRANLELEVLALPHRQRVPALRQSPGIAAKTPRQPATMRSSASVWDWLRFLSTRASRRYTTRWTSPTASPGLEFCRERSSTRSRLRCHSSRSHGVPSIRELLTILNGHLFPFRATDLRHGEPSHGDYSEERN